MSSALRASSASCARGRNRLGRGGHPGWRRDVHRAQPRSPVEADCPVVTSFGPTRPWSMPRSSARSLLLQRVARSRWLRRGRAIAGSWLAASWCSPQTGKCGAGSETLASISRLCLGDRLVACYTRVGGARARPGASSSLAGGTKGTRSAVASWVPHGTHRSPLPPRATSPSPVARAS